jgi:Mrp family chromosome partitioning ATPase
VTLEQYWKLLRKHWYLVPLCICAMGLGTFLVSLLLVPIYQSTALVQVVVHSGSNQGDINDLLASNQLVQTEAMLATSDPVLRDVAAHYPGLSVAQLSQMVTTSSRLNTQLFEINVQDTNPTHAAQIANDIAATLLRQQTNATNNANDTSRKQIQQEINTTQQQITSVKTKLAAAHNSDSGSGSAQIDTLTDQLDTLQQHRTQWQNALAQLELTEAESSDFLRIVQPAQPATEALRPNIPLYSLSGSITGLLLGSLLVIVWAKLDQRVRTPEDVREIVEWPVLATLRRIEALEGPSQPIHLSTSDMNREVYHLLRVAVNYTQINKPLRTLIVTSAQAQEGKSTVAAHLACSIAATGKNILLIDANLRRPALHTLFGLPAHTQGLGNAILACGMSAQKKTKVNTIRHMASQQTEEAHTIDVSLDRFIHAVGLANLAVMPSGPLPPNPSELLDSKAMQRLLLALGRSTIDMIIFDTPPVHDLSDTCTLAAHVDGILFVVDVCHTHKPHLKQASAMLQQTGAHIIGCVLNKQSGNQRYAAYTTPDMQDLEGTDISTFS